MTKDWTRPNLDKSKNLSFGDLLKYLTLSNDNILAQTKLKEFVDDKIKCCVNDDFCL